MSDIRLYAKQVGEGAPLILLHGNGQDHSFFERQIEFFCHSYRVIAIDTRGHGRSPRGDRPFTFGQFAEDLHDFMEENRVEKADIIGFSDGGNIALTFALKYPEMVNKLVLNSANLWPEGLKNSFKTTAAIGHKIARGFGKGEKLALIVNEPKIEAAELAKLKMPVLLIAGDRDIIKREHTELIHKSIPGSELAILPGNHGFAKSNPIVFNKRVNEFLSKE